MYIHVFVLHRKFEQILIKIRFFTNFKSCSKSHVHVSLYCLSVQETCCLAHLACFVGSPEMEREREGEEER